MVLGIRAEALVLAAPPAFREAISDALEVGQARRELGDPPAGMQLLESTTVQGGYVAAGVAMRNRGYGSITLSTIPPGSTVVDAYLLWDVLASSESAGLAQGTFNGTSITGTQVATGATPCWPPTNNYSYVANIAGLVAGNGSYSLSGFASGVTNGQDPWTAGSTEPDLEGATLVITYANAASPETGVQLYAGATMTEGDLLSQTMTGFTATTAPSAETTFIVADGQSAPDGGATFNSTALPNSEFQGQDPQAGANYSNGNLWDTESFDVSSLVTAGADTATATVQGGPDCLVWVGQVFSVSGAAQAGGGIAPMGAVGYATGDATRHDPVCNNGPSPVNCASGDFWHTFSDVSVPGRGPGLDLTRTYNSLSASSASLFGYGWSSSYAMDLVVNADSSVTITEDDGSQVTAEPLGNGAYSLPGFSDSTLSQSSGGGWSFVRQRTETYSFNSAGKLTAITDLNGYSTTLGYNASGQLTTITDAAGRSISLSYGSNGFVSQLTDPAGESTTYGYDSSGDLTSVSDPMGRVTSFGYDPSGDHLLLTMTDPDGGTTTNVYNASGQITSQSDPMGRTTTYGYSGNNFSGGGGTTTITDSHGNEEIEQYANGELLIVTKGANSAHPSRWRFTYDPATLGETSVTDPDGHTTTSSYDADGNLLSSTDALGNTTSYVYNALDEVTSETDPDGMLVTYSYDAAGDLLDKVVSGVQSTLSLGPWSSAVIDTSFSPTALSCPSTSLCVAGDAGGDLFVTTAPQSPGSWSEEGRIVQSDITAISCVAVRQGASYSCTAVDNAGDAISSDNPTGGLSAWSVGTPDPGVAMTGVSCPGADQCVAVDHEGDVLVDGDGGWSIVSHVDGYNPLTAISCPSTSLCVATDSVGDLLTSAAPTDAATAAWQVQSAVDTHELTAASCPTETLCVVVDTAGNGFFSENPSGGKSQWIAEPGIDAGHVLTALSCPTSTMCLGVDGVGNAMYSADPIGGAQSWSDASVVDTSAGLVGVSCPAVGVCAALDKRGNALSVAPSETSSTLSQTWQLVYGDGSHPGDVTQLTDPDGHVATFAYDTNGDHVSTTTHPSSGVADTTDDVYDVLGRRVCEAAPDAVAAGTSCPSAGSPRVADTATWSYDADGEVTSTTDPLGGTTSYVYDHDGDVTQVSHPAGDVTQSAYDLDHRPTTVTTGTGAATSTTSYGYDIAPGSGACSASVVQESYCTTTRSPLGAVTVAYFDAEGRKVAETQPASGTTTFSYDPAGNVVGDVVPGGTTSDTYDADNRLIGVSSTAASGFASVGAMSWSYDSMGRRLQMTDETGTTSYHYDALGRLVGVTDGAGATVSYGYDADSRVTSIGYPSGGSVTRGFDGAGELTSVTDWDAHTATFSYDHGGNLVSEVLPDGVSSASSFNDASQLTSITDARSSAPSDVLASFGYGRNGDGQVTSETDTGMPGPQSQSYSYDSQSRLASDSSGSYGYDAGSDLVGLSNGTTQRFNPAGQLLSSTPSGGSATSYGYDAQGNRTTTTVPGSGTTTFGFDQDNELVSADGVGYSYNGDGLRMAKLVGSQPTQEFTWDVSASQPLFLSDGTVDYVYGPDGLPFEQLAAAGPTLVGTSTDETEVTTTQLAGASVALSVPASAEPGDELLVSVTEDAGQSASITGASAVGSWSTGTGVMLQVLAYPLSTPQSSLTVSFAATNDAHPVAFVVAVYRGVNTANPVDASGGSTSSSSPVSAPPVTTTQPDDKLVVFQGALNNPSGAGWTASSGMTEEAQVNQSSLVSSGIADATVSSAGSTGTKSSAFGGVSVSLASAAIALRPGALDYLHDQLGSTRALLNGTGTVVASYTYNPLGQLVASSGVPGIAGANRIGFADAYKDPESGLLYLQHRYYDPATGQFLSSDPVVDVTGKAYQYGAGDPINSIDPTGEYSQNATLTERVDGIDLTVNANFAVAVQAAASSDNTPQMAAALLEAYYPEISGSGYLPDLVDPAPAGTPVADIYALQVLQFVQTVTGFGSEGAWYQFSDAQGPYYNQDLAYYVWELDLANASALINAAVDLLQEAMKKGMTAGLELDVCGGSQGITIE